MITELVIGYILPGKPLANVSFKTYGYISMAQALSFLGGRNVEAQDDIAAIAGQQMRGRSMAVEGSAG